MAERLTALAAKTFSRLVQSVETDLAFHLLKEFNDVKALSNLQQLADNCIRQMLRTPSALKTALKNENKLKVEGKTGHSFDELFEFSTRQYDSGVGTFDASDVSDIIRLFGEFVEQGGTAAAGLQQEWKWDPQKGPKGEWQKIKEKDDWGKSHSPSDLIKQAYRGGVPGAPGSYMQNAGRVWAETKIKDGEVIPIMHDPNDPRDFRNRGAGWQVESWADKRPDKSTFSGMGGIGAQATGSKRAKGDSNVLKIDRLFGLIVGADISGTTADTVYAVEVLGRDILSATYYMLPLATIVCNNHHALLEVALALSLNGVIDYNIGFYTSLLPKAVKTIPPELTGIDGILQTAENRFKNQRLVTFYNAHNELAGGFLLTDDEARKGHFNAMELLKYAPNLPRYPTIGTLNKLFSVKDSGALLDL
jgi:hypothetical protein